MFELKDIIPANHNPKENYAEETWMIQITTLPWTKHLKEKLAKSINMVICLIKTFPYAL